MNLTLKFLTPTVFAAALGTQSAAQTSLDAVSFEKLDRLLAQIGQIVSAGQDFALLSDETDDDSSLLPGAQVCFAGGDLGFASFTEAEEFIAQNKVVSSDVDNLFGNIDDLLRSNNDSVKKAGCDLLGNSLEPEMKKFGAKDPLYKVLFHLDDCSANQSAGQEFDPAELADSLKDALKRIDRASNRYDTLAAACK